MQNMIVRKNEMRNVILKSHIKIKTIYYKKHIFIILKINAHQHTAYLKKTKHCPEL